jgi:hypothetical protein
LVETIPWIHSHARLRQCLTRSEEHVLLIRAIPFLPGRRILSWNFRHPRDLFWLFGFISSFWR